MVVGRKNFGRVLAELLQHPCLSLDTETTGLRPYHGDRLFSLILSHGAPGGSSWASYYFNFQPYPGLDPDSVLLPEHLEGLKLLFRRPDITWYLHTAKYDMAILAQEGIFLAGTVHCVRAAALLEYNEHVSYDLDSCAERIGFRKDDAVSRYIDDHELKEKRPGATTSYTHKFYDRVPYDIIVPYGEQDAGITYCLGQYQEAALSRLNETTPPSVPHLRQVLDNERKLTKTLFAMEHLGVRIDRPYCVRAASYEADRMEKVLARFKTETGRELVNSIKCFSEVFANEKDKWVWGERTPTGQLNPSFTSDVLEKFQNPAAQMVLTYRDAKSKRDFYRGFLYHADATDEVHPTYNQDGAGHGRLSSASPNFQNLTSEDVVECQACGKGFEELVDKCKKCGGEIQGKEFLVRRALVPRPGFIWIMPDWDQMEYRMMFDVACDIAGEESQIVREIKAGKDPHQATADVVCALGGTLDRQRAKNGNFAILYGSGDETLAATIKGTLAEARALRLMMRQASPEVTQYTALVRQTARARGFIRNWFGRRCYLPNPRFAYAMPNYHIAGGCADVAKVSMNRIADLCQGLRSRLVMTVHDEFPMEIHESEVSTVPRQVKEIMEGVYPWVYLPLTVGMEWSDKSLADKKKGFPV